LLLASGGAPATGTSSVAWSVVIGVDMAVLFCGGV
jgi:hypothetical protein